jgi:hypothetical protein
MNPQSAQSAQSFRSLWRSCLLQAADGAGAQRSTVPPLKGGDCTVRTCACRGCAENTEQWRSPRRSRDAVT